MIYRMFDFGLASEPYEIERITTGPRMLRYFVWPDRTVSPAVLMYDVVFVEKEYWKVFEIRVRVFRTPYYEK